MCEIYNDKYHGVRVGRIEGDEIYNDRYHGECVGRIEGNEVYNDRYHGDCVGRIEGTSVREGTAALLLLLIHDSTAAGFGSSESDEQESDSSDDHDRSDESGGTADHCAARPAGARWARNPSTCQPGVCRRAPGGGKCDPSRVRDTRAGGRDDRGGLLGCGGVAGEPPPPTVRTRRCDSSACSTRGRDRRRHRSRRPDDRDGTSSGGAECPRCRSSGPLPLDVPPKPWHKRQDGLGVLEPEAVTRVRRFSPGPHPQPAQPTRSRVHATAKRPWTLPAPTAIIFFLIIRPDRKDPAREVQISTLLRGYQQGIVARVIRLLVIAILCRCRRSFPNRARARGESEIFLRNSLLGRRLPNASRASFPFGAS